LCCRICDPPICDPPSYELRGVDPFDPWSEPSPMLAKPASERVALKGLMPPGDIPPRFGNRRKFISLA
jgi:hypothetical protein